MNDRGYRKLTNAQKYNLNKLNKLNRHASMVGNEPSALEENLNYYTWSMTHKPFSTELNELGIRVEEEKKRRGLL